MSWRRAADREPCGTMAAARRHWRYGEVPCEACRAAELEYQRARKGSVPFRPAVCGTVGGYRKHLKAKERPCGECRAANAENMRQYKARRARQEEQ